MTLCTECKHFAEGRYGYGCRALRGQTNPVTGQLIEDIAADTMRMTLCGWSDPKLFEPKPIEPTPK